MLASPAYLILNETECCNGLSDVVNKHRIAARTILSKSKENMKRRIQNFEKNMTPNRLRRE